MYASNITPDAATGIGDWSAAHFWRALHNGRSRDGRLLYPAFPYPNYTLVTRADSDAMFDYLRSLPAGRASPTRPHQLRWPYSTQAALAVWRALYFTPGAARGRPRAVGRVEPRRLPGARASAIAAPATAARNALGASSDMMDLSGGLIPMQNWYAPSLASPAEAGVGDWELADIERLLRTGVSPRGTVLGPMAEVVLHSTQHLAAADLRAMAVFLKALPQRPARDAARAVPPPVASRVAERGAKLYEQHCAQCHGAAGRGRCGRLSRRWRAIAPSTMPVTANLVQVVLQRRLPAGHGRQPAPLRHAALRDRPVATPTWPPCSAYIRAAWGNRAAAVSELAVSRQRGGS